MTRRPRTLLLALCLGFALRAGYSSWAMLSGRSLPSNDGYETIARRLVEAGRYEALPGVPTAAREPGFPLLIAFLYALFGFHPLVVTLALSVLSTATAWLLREACRRRFGEDAGNMTLLAALLYPYFIFYTGYMYRETLVCFLLAAFLLASSVLYERPTLRNAALTGLCSGAAAASFSSVLPSCALLSLFAAWRLGRRHARAAAVVLAFSALPSALWTARNYAVFGRFIPGSTIGGFNFYTYLIVPDEARGLPRENEIKYSDREWLRINDMGDLMHDDGRQQAAYFEAGRRWVAEHPGAYALRTLRQFAKLWRPYPYRRDYQHPYWLIMLVSLLSDGWLIPLGAWALWKRRRAGPETASYLLLLSSASLVYSLLAAIVRYRLPLMLPLLICAGAALADWPPARRLLAAMRA